MSTELTLMQVAVDWERKQNSKEGLLLELQLHTSGDRNFSACSN